jgi:hypothetical protein
MTTNAAEAAELFRAKLDETFVELSDKYDTLTLLRVLGVAFLNAAAGCAPSRAAYDHEVDLMSDARDAVWNQAHLN